MVIIIEINCFEKYEFVVRRKNNTIVKNERAYIQWLSFVVEKCFSGHPIAGVTCLAEIADCPIWRGDSILPNHPILSDYLCNSPL